MLATILTENRGGNRLKSCCRLAWHAAAAQGDSKAWTVDQVLGETPRATTCQRTTDRRATLPGPAVSNKGVMSLSVWGLASENHRGAE